MDIRTQHANDSSEDHPCSNPGGDAVDRSAQHALARKLMMAFLQFHRIEAQQKSFMGYKPSEIRLLFCIRRGWLADLHEMKVSEISKILHVTSPTVTQLLKGLEADGLVERRIDPADRRVVYIKLSEKGVAITQKAGEALFLSMSGLIEHLGEAKSQQLAELLKEVSCYFTDKEASLRQVQWSGDEIP